MLKVLNEKVERRNGSWLSDYMCECGNIKRMLESNVKRGLSKSCGCKQKAAVSKASRKHGMFGTKVYGIWQGMKGRCLVKSNHSYKTYGAKGISVCERWLSFENFLADMGEPPEGHTLDRVDGSLGYSKENCRWATYSEQAINTKTSSRNKTGVRGVSFNKSRNRFVARITINNKTINLGTFKKIEDAKFAREAAEDLYFR